MRAAHWIETGWVYLTAYICISGVWSDYGSLHVYIYGKAAMLACFASLCAWGGIQRNEIREISTYLPCHVSFLVQCRVILHRGAVLSASLPFSESRMR
jgi:hypothetical protein